MKTHSGAVAFALIVAACGGAPKPAEDPTAAGAGAAETPPDGAAAEASPEEAGKAPAPFKHPTAAEIFEHIKDDLQACYVEGKKAAPKMGSGRLTLHSSVDASGKTTCVIPSDDTGLTQEVEDCMSRRLAKEAYPGGAAWSTEMMIVVKGGKVALGDLDASDGASFESVETHGLSDSTAVVKTMMPKLNACVNELGDSSHLRVVYVGGRIGEHGEVQCALATGAEDLPDSVRACAARVIAEAKFGAPKSGQGLVSIPVKVMGQKAK